MTETMPPIETVSPAVRIWLWLIAALIFCMVIVGGATRLTDSGLSITEWRPLLGAIPPLNEANWLEAFHKYQQIPEYQVQNKGMSLVDFKFIYWWEWAHRFLGRIIGLVFVLPLVWFMATRTIPRRLWPRLTTLFLLGGAQGALGWFMVASGLSERVDVSQYRLSAHLTFAVFLFAAIVWTALGLNARRTWPATRDSKIAMLLLILLFVQVAAGGFVAGLDAGYASDTWPKMNGAWFPDGLGALSPAWRNMFENALAVQFNHRILAYVICGVALWMWWSSRATTASAVIAAITLQVALGILTVLWSVPLSIALLHQGGALLVIALTLRHMHRLMVRTGSSA
jgi:heme a synthase